MSKTVNELAREAHEALLYDKHFAELQPCRTCVVIALALIEHEKAVREEDCRLMCGPCGDGRPVVCGQEAGKPDIWVHPSGRGVSSELCWARPIRARKPADTEEGA